MTVSFADEREDPSLPSPVDAIGLTDLATATLVAESVPSESEVVITLVDPPRMSQLNERYMGRAGPTDVLSFPLEELSPGDSPAATPGGPPVALGDVFICPAVVADNAAESAVPFRHEMALMVVHGLLHLLGYDHVVDSEAEQMEQRERDLLSAAGLVRP